MITQIRPSELETWLKGARALGEPVVLDVREVDEVRIASIKADGFELITIPMGLVPVRLAELDPARPIACLCHHGGRSMNVANFLRGRGFAHVANVSGGIHAWSHEVDPSVPRY